MEHEAYPLSWPTGCPRTSNYQKQKSNFKVSSFAVARDNLFHELKLFRATDVILSTNIPLRRDGIPYAGYRQPDDVGVAVYFKIKGQTKVFACDKWTKIEDNIHAVMKTIDALRGIQRWGSSDLMDRAFTGFTALPAPTAKRPWHVVLGISETCSAEAAKARRNILLMENHPDRGGNPQKTSEINQAYDEFKNERGLS